MDITVFELHFPEAQFNAPFANSDATEDSDGERATGPPEPAGGSDGSGLGPVVALLVLAGLAALAWYLRRPDDGTGIEAASEAE